MNEAGGHTLGDVLRSSREAKGVDLARVERDTKIRERYLTALEHGDYLELPGSVYTRGFLRNYGAYLGLDPDYLIDLYRLETSTTSERTRLAPAPRPMAAKRSRAFVVTPSAVMAAILTIGVGAFVAWLAYGFVNFARTPDLRITDPVGNVSGYTDTEITLRGVTEKNARITVRGLPENPVVQADETGNFEVTLELLPGSNVIELIARDPETNRDSAVQQRTIIVGSEVAESPTPAPVAFEVAEPQADASVTSPVAVAGSAEPGSDVTVAVQLTEEPSPTFTVTDATGAAVSIDAQPPSTPEPATLTTDESGAYAGTLTLGAGTWEVTVSTDGAPPVVRRVTVVPADGVGVRVRVTGAESYLELAEDGEVNTDWSGPIADDGEVVDLRGTEEVRVRAGNAGAVRLSVNGITLGAMGGNGEVVEWRIVRSGG